MKLATATKQRLLDTAIKLIWEQSYGSVSVDDICAQANANKGSFYHFFRSKSALAVTAMETHWQMIAPQMAKDFADDAPPLTRLKRFCQSVYLRQQVKRQQVGRVCGCAFTCLGMELSTQDEAVRHQSQYIVTQYCRFLEATIRAGVRDGTIEPQPARAQARVLYGCVIATLVQARIDNDLDCVRRLYPTMLRVLGVRATKKRSRRKGILMV